MVTKKSTIQKSAEQRAAEKNGHPLISNEKFRQLYATMLKCRMLGERRRLLSENDEPAVEHEASAAGIVLDLRREDTLLSSSRDFLTPFIKGVPLKAMLSPDAGDKNGAYPPLNILSPSTAERMNIILGIALNNKTKKNGNIAVVFLENSSAAQGVWHEALIAAGVHDLPMIFVVQNAVFTEQEPLKQRTKAKASDAEASTYTFPSIPVDGSDVVAVYRVAQESIARARQDGGPTLIECKRDSQFSHDPIRNMETYLAGRGLFDSEWKEQIAREFARELDAAVKP